MAEQTENQKEKLYPLDLFKVDPKTLRQTGKDEPYAYTITDVNFGEFKVLNTANGWWLDQQKVQLLIAAYKIDASDEEACAYAGIRAENLRYFKDMHPDFLHVKAACKQLPFLTARNTIVSGLASDSKMALDYMERKRKHEFGRRDEHVVIPTEKTLEDLFDEYEKENGSINEQGDNRKVAEDKKQGGANSSVQAEHSSTVLLGEENSKEPDTKAEAKGA